MSKTECPDEAEYKSPEAPIQTLGARRHETIVVGFDHTMTESRVRVGVHIDRRTYLGRDAPR